MVDRRDAYNQMDREKHADVIGNPAGGAASGYGDTRVGEKGVMDKIKEKMPGTHTTTDTGYPHGQQQHQKKGMMEKIKEKMPGSHSQTTAGTGAAATTTDTGYAHGKEHGKKGTMEKIKEKLPGTGHHR